MLNEFHESRWKEAHKRYVNQRQLVVLIWAVAILAGGGSCYMAVEGRGAWEGVLAAMILAVFGSVLSMLIDVAVHLARISRATEESLWMSTPEVRPAQYHPAPVPAPPTSSALAAGPGIEVVEDEELTSEISESPISKPADPAIPPTEGVCPKCGFRARPKPGAGIKAGSMVKCPKCTGRIRMS